MSTKLKLLTIFIALMLCFSLCSLSAYAVGEGEDIIYDDEPSYEEPDISSDIPDTPPEDVSSDVGYEDSSDISYDESSDYSSEQPDYSSEQPDYSSDYYDDSSYVDDYNDYSDNSYSSEDPYSDDYSYYDDSYNDYSDYSYDSYVGGGQTYVVPESTAPYDVKDAIDVNELNSSDWNDIAASLKNASSSDDDGGDFNFIKKNNSTSDNGDWMMYVGIICLVLGVAGIAYVIVSSVRNRKKASSGKRNTHSSDGKKPAAATAGASGGRYRAGDDYGDGYRSQKKKTERRSKYDTADVKLPKSSQAAHRKTNGSNGKRYR